MADCFCTPDTWPEEGNALPCHSLIVPTWPPPGNVSSSSTQFQGLTPPWPIPVEGVVERKAASASKSHSLAEKRRRERINAQLATLRKFIPRSEKMDKAALLGSVIKRVKELKRKATESTKSFTIPTEVDEVSIEYYDMDRDDPDIRRLGGLPSCHKKCMDQKNVFIRASLCCEDRPELFAEIVGALKALRLTLVQCDIASVGGRTKSILILCPTAETKRSEEGSALKESVRVVLSRIAASTSVASSYCLTSRRQRFFLPSH